MVFHNFAKKINILENGIFLNKELIDNQNTLLIISGCLLQVILYVINKTKPSLTTLLNKHNKLIH